MAVVVVAVVVVVVALRAATSVRVPADVARQRLKQSLDDEKDDDAGEHAHSER